MFVSSMKTTEPDAKAEHHGHCSDPARTTAGFDAAGVLRAARSLRYPAKIGTGREISPQHALERNQKGEGISVMVTYF
jgi:hypothetical protein